MAIISERLFTLRAAKHRDLQRFNVEFDLPELTALEGYNLNHDDRNQQISFHQSVAHPEHSCMNAEEYGRGNV